MNFLLRNIGWVFLFLFFLFMLFIIATNNPNTQETSEIIEQEVDSDTIDPIDALIERLENEDEKGELPQENRDEEARENSDIEASSQRGFFARLFGRNGGDEINEEVEVTIEPEEDIIGESGPLSEVDSSKSLSSSQDIPENTHNSEVYTNNSGLIATGEKTSSWLDTPVVAFYDEDDISSLQEAEVQVSDVFFEVSPYSLRLNNKYFSETLGYLMQGDILKQIGAKNHYGCFEVEVHSSQTAHGKVGYVCEKYLTHLPHGILETEIVPLESISDVPMTEIGDIIILETDQLDIQGKALFSGDSIDQMTEIDANGCFVGRVYFVQSGGYQELIGLVQTFCLQELYR